MILNSGKPPNKVDSYRPIFLLPIMSKLFQKLLLIRLFLAFNSFKSLHSSWKYKCRIAHRLQVHTLADDSRGYKVISSLRLF
jgi:hypothetical protein